MVLGTEVSLTLFLAISANDRVPPMVELAEDSKGFDRLESLLDETEKVSKLASFANLD